MQLARKLCLGVAGASLLLLAVGLVIGSASLWQPAAVAACVGLAIGLGAVPTLRTYQFTAWIVAAVVTAMIYPSRLLHLGPINLENSWIKLLVIQAVMFGMGTQMSLKDFAGVARMPWGVFVGIFCQFTVMPLVGFGLTKLFHFPDEVAAGIILIGSCSSGLASNVMVYLSRGNLALSITLTSVATLLAPLMTPFWMTVLAGELVPVKFVVLMLEVIKIVIVPVGAAMLHDYLKHASTGGCRIVAIAAAGAATWLLFLAFGGWEYVAGNTSEAVARWLGAAGFVMGAIVAGVTYHGLARRWTGLDGYMPLVSMFGIVYFTAVTTAVGRDKLLEVGGLLFLAAVIHNTFGYILGYWLSRAMGLDRSSARTVAFEVGLQNGGMALGLAEALGKLSTMGLAPAVFSPWQNVSGSILANYWRKRPTDSHDSLADATGRSERNSD